uniref:(northern house mosquito) hypothetical protein n=1 Tax=Culex pipiens TaxID=7175 RepID=A0A8D7ZYY6_CULPI
MVCFGPAAVAQVLEQLHAQIRKFRKNVARKNIPRNSVNPALVVALFGQNLAQFVHRMVLGLGAVVQIRSTRRAAHALHRGATPSGGILLHLPVRIGLNCGGHSAGMSTRLAAVRISHRVRPRSTESSSKKKVAPRGTFYNT